MLFPNLRVNFLRSPHLIDPSPYLLYSRLISGALTVFSVMPDVFGNPLTV